MKRGIMLRQSKSDGAIISLSLCPALMLTGLIFSSSASATDPSSSATATVHVSEACSLTSTVITPHTDNMSNGTSTESLGSTKFTVKCNDASGFALYAIGYSGDQYGATSMLGDNELSIPTGTDAANGNTTSHWSMKISKDTTSYLPNSLTIENSFGSQHLIPSTYTKIASFPSSTDGINGTGSSILATYGVRISGTQAAGTYIGKVKYTLVHPNMVNNENKPPEPLQATDCPAYSICYAPNTPDIVGTMVSTGNTAPTLTSIAVSPIAAKQTQTRSDPNSTVDISSNSPVQLIAPNYSREGYGFAGWSTDYEATSSSTIYGPNETITLGDVSTNGLILYPVWIASAGNFQSWSGCSSLTQAPTNTRATLASMTALTDTRDNNVYAVARLADGKCWMVENLRLDNTATITTANTHSPLNTSGNVTLKIDYDNNIIADHLATSNNNWCNDGSAACFDKTMLNTNNTNRALDPFYNGNGNAAHYQWYSYGNYYNWYSATAGNGTTSFYTKNNSVAGDLCPTGWRLPVGGQTTVNTNGDFYVLTKTLMGGTEPNQIDTTYHDDGFEYYNGIVDNVDLGAKASNVLRAFPTNFINSGSRSRTQVQGRGRAVYYWSSTSAHNAANAYSLVVSIYYAYPGTFAAGRSQGASVRCIAQ